MSLYRRSNRSSDPCSAIALVVPVALEYWKPGSTKKVAPPTLQALAAWQSGGTWRRQFCCSYWYPSSMQGLTCTVQAKSNASRVGVGASRVVGYSCSLRTSLTFSKNCVITVLAPIQTQLAGMMVWCWCCYRYRLQFDWSKLVKFWHRREKGAHKVDTHKLYRHFWKKQTS